MALKEGRNLVYTCQNLCKRNACMGIWRLDNPSMDKWYFSVVCTYRMGISKCMSAERFLYSPVTDVYYYCSKSGVSHTAVLLWNMEFKLTILMTTFHSSLHCCPTVVCSMI